MKEAIKFGCKAAIVFLLLLFLYKNYQQTKLPQIGLTQNEYKEVIQKNRASDETQNEYVTSKKQQLSLTGVIVIPTLDLEMGIKEYSDNQQLFNQGMSETAIEYKPRQVMGEKNYTLISHNYLNTFDKLLSIKKGSLIYVTDFQKVYEYQTEEAYRINEADSSVVNDQAKKEITLITCVGEVGTVWRWIVKGKLVKSYDVSNVSPEIRNVFSKGSLGK